MSQISDNNINVDKLNKMHLENNSLIEDDKTEKCEDNINVEKNVENEEIKNNIEKQNKDKEIYNNDEVQLECFKEKDIKIEETIDYESARNDSEVQVENKEEVESKDNIVIGKNIVDEEIKNNIEKQNKDEEIHNNDEVQLECVKEQSFKEKDTKIEEIIDYESVRNDSEVQVENKEEVEFEDNIVVEKNIVDEELKNDTEKKNNDIEVNNNEKQLVLSDQEENNVSEEIAYLDKEESKNEILKDDIEEKENEEVLILNNDFNEYKYQIEQDVIAYERNLLNYKQWALDGKELVLKSKKTFEKIEFIVEKFNKEMLIKLERLSDEDKKLFENRIKGINMINKMSKNAINNGANKLLEKINQEFNDIKITNNINNKDEDEIRHILNDNYGSITHIESKKSNLVDVYFDFIERSLLPILDGIESGISFVKNSNKEIILKGILPIYIELNKYFDELLLSINVRKIEVELKTKIDFSYFDVVDIESTEEENLDETIESVIRNGYEYLKDIYGIGRNHIIRPVQIVAYKYNK